MSSFYSTPSRWFCSVHKHVMLIVRHKRRETGLSPYRRDHPRNPRLYCPQCGFVRKPK